jgi:cell filamentation protein
MSNEQLEGSLAGNRISELRETPVWGRFDAAHLREIHRRIFQDFPSHGFDGFSPGEYRSPQPAGADWHKNRMYESQGVVLTVAYSRMDSDAIARLDKVLEKANPAELSKLNTAEFTEAMGRLYAALDYIHPFREGNSRSLREFTRQLADESGYNLDWTRFNKNIYGRDVLYLARDKSVNELAYPSILDPEIKRDVVFSMDALASNRDMPDLLKDAILPQERNRLP